MEGQELEIGQMLETEGETPVTPAPSAPAGPEAPPAEPPVAPAEPPAAEPPQPGVIPPTPGSEPSAPAAPSAPAPAAPEVPPAAPAAPAAPAKSEADQLREDFAVRESALLEQMRAMAMRAMAAGVTPQTPPETPAPAAPGAAENVVFIKDEKEADEIINSADKLNALLNKVMQMAKSAAVEESLVRLPEVARTVSSQQISTAAAVQDFYRANSDLIGYSSFVKFVADDLISKHPEWGMEELLKGTAPEVRKRLRLPDPQTTPAPAPGPGAPPTPPQTPPPTPGFVPGPGVGPRVPPAAPLTGQEAEIDAMLTTL